MPTIGSITKTIRINPSDLAIIEGLMADGTSWSGAIHKLCEGTPVKKTVLDDDVVKEIHSMAEFCKVGTNTLMKDILSGLMEGNLLIRGGKVVGRPEYDLDELEEACHDRGITVQEAINKTIKSLKGGK